jgi:hypothetical protein
MANIATKPFVNSAAKIAYSDNNNKEKLKKVFVKDNKLLCS